VIGLTSSRDEASRALAAWLSGPRAPSLAPSTTGPLVLFLCHINTALSIMAEAILRHLAQERVRAASAGYSVADRVNSQALECLRTHGLATEGLKSKAWGQFFGLYRPTVRLVITLGDVYVAKVRWPRDTQIANWKMPDPADVVGSEVDVRVAFEKAFGTLDLRIRQFLSLPLGQLKGRALVQELERIGEAS
jgi:arsenate reductase